MRESTLINIPHEYKDNESKGLCRVCAKPKSEWEKGRQLYCGDKCSMKYQECFKTWSIVREDIIKRDKNNCVQCGITFPDHELEVDHIQAIINGGEMWDYDNLRTLCSKCHGKKSGKDRYIANRMKAGQTQLTQKKELKKECLIYNITKKRIRKIS